MNLLNENGTLDYVLPMHNYINNQYVSMVYAHQAYWDSAEFARLVVVECGRHKGEAFYKCLKTLPVIEHVNKLPPR